MAVKKSYGGISAGPQYKTPGETIPFEMPPDNFLLFGDPEGYNALVGYSTASPGGFGIGRGSGTNAVGFFLSNDDTIYLVNRWDPSLTGAKLGIRISTAGGARYIELNAKDVGSKPRAMITLRGDTGNENLNLYCIGQSTLGSSNYKLAIVPSAGTVTLQAGMMGGSSIILDDTGYISLNGNIGIATDKRLDCTGATLCIPQAAPASPQVGDMYVDTANSRLYVYDGTTWKYATLT